MREEEEEGAVGRRGRRNEERGRRSGENREKE